LLTVLFGCSPSPEAPAERESIGQESGQLKAAATRNTSTGAMASSTDMSQPTALPVRFQNPTYTLADAENGIESLGVEEEFVVEVGANFSTSGAVMLRDIMKRLAAHKRMNISWASDVDQYAYVDVDIRASDDFFKAIDNLLRQRDYFHEVQGNTIVVKYKETRKFHLAMPFLSTNFSKNVGMTVSADSNVKLDSTANNFDIWDNIQKNLDQVLEIWEDTSASVAPVETTTETDTETTVDETEDTAPAPVVSRPQSSKGYYTIDRPIGLITVTAPRSIVEKVESYINNLKSELYKQISIEAKILEVEVSSSKSVGIDWKSLLESSPFSVNMTFGPSSISQPFGPSGSRSFTIATKNFTALVSAIERQGKTKVLSNPRISVMNWQLARINVGKTVTYIESIAVDIDDDTGIRTYTATAAEKVSGVMLSVVATVMDDDQIILNLTPMTSQLEEPIVYEPVGEGKIGLPVVKRREMSTLVRVNQGDMLVVGGLVDSTNDGSDDTVPVLSKIPILGKLFFSLENKVKSHKELVILLKPEII